VWRLRVVLKATCVATESGVEGDLCGGLRVVAVCVCV
jgi:hypothetical protein